MIKIENTEVVGWEHAIRGMRNPMNSWEKSDTVMSVELRHGDEHAKVYADIGENDLNLMKRLANAGTDHRKFMRMIVVYADITAPRFWWAEADTYKVGTVRNSCSTMHKITSKEFTLDDFSVEHLLGRDGNCDEADFVLMGDGARLSALGVMADTVKTLNFFRRRYIETKNKEYWWQLIQLLPASYNQRATLMLNYEVLANIYHSRRYHKLDEWREFCAWIETLPYSELITGGKRNGQA